MVVPKPVCASSPSSRARRRPAVSARPNISRSSDGDTRPPSGLRWAGDKAWWEHLLRSSRGGFWVAEEGSTLIRIASAVVRDAECLLTHLYVVPEKQGRGVGRGLLERALRSARGTG